MTPERKQQAAALLEAQAMQLAAEHFNPITSTWRNQVYKRAHDRLCALAAELRAEAEKKYDALR